MVVIREDTVWTVMAMELDVVILIINMMATTAEGTQTSVVAITAVATVVGVLGTWSMKAATLVVMVEIGGEEIATMIVLVMVEITGTMMGMEGDILTGIIVMVRMEGATPTGIITMDMEGAMEWVITKGIINK